MPGDRQRFTLAHELGHLLLEFPADLDADTAEKLVYRFAAAFIVPREAARAELGDRRRRLDLIELALLKREYGLSMAAWVHRAEELGILPEAAARSLFETFDKAGWRLREPGEPYPSQDPRRFERLVRHALAEEVISETRAAELLGRAVTPCRAQDSGAGKLKVKTQRPEELSFPRPPAVPGRMTSSTRSGRKPPRGTSAC